MKNTSRNGISLIVLIITIIVVIVLSSAAIFQGVVSFDESKISSFADDLYKIEDALESYYIIHESVPTLNNLDQMSSSDLFNNYLSASNLEKFNEELNLNQDSGATFYLIDPLTLGVSNLQRGLMKNGNDDVYAASYPNLNVYYLNGISANNGIYFSISSKMDRYVNKKSINYDTSVIDAYLSSGIIVTKASTNPTNKMGINIKTNMKNNEELFIKIGNLPSNISFKTTPGIFEVSFDSFDELNNSGKLNTLIMQEDMDHFNDNKYIEIIKESEGQVICTKKIDLLNYDNMITGNFYDTDYSYTEYANFNVLLVNTTNLETGGSKIKYITYDYLTKINSTGQEVEFYDGILDFDVDYMLSKAKVVDVEKNGVVAIKLDKNISSVKIAVVDNAENALLIDLVLDAAHKSME